MCGAAGGRAKPWGTAMHWSQYELTFIEKHQNKRICSVLFGATMDAVAGMLIHSIALRPKVGQRGPG